VREVIAPEVFTHMICDDLGVGYDYVLENILYDPRAWKYGSLSQKKSWPELWEYLGLKSSTQTGRGRRVQARK
jgi:hypothetical protein